jgi:hypothetical protein
VTLRRADSERNTGLRAAALVGMLIGAAGSLIFLFHAAGQGVSFTLISVMAIWVLAPFAALELARRIARRSTPSSTAIDVLVLFLAVASLAAYAVNIGRPLNATKAAFPFVIVPLISWLLIVATLVLARAKKSH